MRNRSTDRQGGTLSGESGLRLGGFGRGLLFFLMATAALAQTESGLESDEVKRVGSHLTCQCGCKDNLNCMMSGGQCPFCKPARTKIFRMQQAGMSDSAIVASFLVDFGNKMLRPDPGSSFWLVPYFSFGAGGILIAFILMRMRGGGHKRPLPAGSPDGETGRPAGAAEACFARYRDAIERDTATLD
jgi:cytochrome c-type biogenesis protein CcmH/NrfF